MSPLSPPKLDTSVNIGNVLLATGMIIGGVIAWTSVREKTLQNTDNIAQLQVIQSEGIRSQRDLENRVITIENMLTFGSGRLERIDSNLQQLKEDFEHFTEKPSPLDSGGPR